jgi:hypothetical protein
MTIASLIWGLLLSWPAIYDSGSGVPWGIVTDSEGNVIVMGEVYVERSTRKLDPCGLTTIKYDYNGNMIWKNTWHENTVYAGKVVVDKDDNVYVVGTHSGGAALVIKYSKDGKEEWWKVYSNHTGGGIWRNGLAIDQENNIIIAAVEGLSPWLIKCTPEGKVLWSQTLFFAGTATGVVVDSKNNIIASGSLGPWDGFWTAKFNSTGDIIWTRTYKASWSMTWDMAISKNDEVAVCGGINEGGFLVIKYAPNGNTKWSRSGYGLTGLGIAYDNNENVVAFTVEEKLIKFSHEGFYRWCKNFSKNGTWDWGDVTVDKWNNYYITEDFNGDFYTIKADSEGNVCANEDGEVFIKRQPLLAVFPNPFRGFTYVQTEITGEIKVYDTAGDLVEKTRGRELGFTLPAGVYFIKAVGYSATKIVKLR